MSSSTSGSDAQEQLQVGVVSPQWIPLARDLVLQREQLRVFITKSAVFLILFLLLDRLGGEFLVNGLDRMYGLNAPARILCIGHSHTALGIDKVALEKDLGVPVAKYARNGANLADRLAMIKHYLEKQPSSVQLLVYDVNAHMFTGRGLSLNSHTLFYPFMDSLSVDRYVRQHASSFDYYIRHALKLRRFNLETCNASLRGWLGMRANLKHGTVNIEKLKKEITAGKIRHISFDDECIDYLDDTLRLALEKGIHVVLLFIPTIDLYNRAQSEQYDHAIRMLQQFSSKYDGVTFLDYNPAFSHRHELFYDPIHLNSNGKRLVTERLGQDLKLIIGHIPGQTETHER